ncbi:MAG: helix-turn-helix transcriptional regulator [Lentisphaeria bacterium]
MENPENVKFGFWVKKKRRERNLKQAELAEKINIATGTLSKIEAGKTDNISQRIINKLKNILNYEKSLVVITKTNKPVPLDAKTFGLWCKENRIRIGIKQIDLARELDASANYLSIIESGKAKSIGRKMRQKLELFFESTEGSITPDPVVDHTHILKKIQLPSIEKLFPILEIISKIVSEKDFMDRVTKTSLSMGCPVREAVNSILLFELKKHSIE